MALLNHGQATSQEIIVANEKCRNAIGWKRYYAAALLLPAMLALMFVSSKSSFHFGEALRFPEDSFLNDSRGINPPWCSIRRGLITGICHAIGLLLTLIITLPFLLVRPRWPRSMWAGMVVWQAVLWSSLSIWPAILIYLRTTHPMTPQIATSDWANYAEYSSDWLRLTGLAAWMLAGLWLARSLTHWTNGLLLREYFPDKSKTV